MTQKQNVRLLQIRFNLYQDRIAALSPRVIVDPLTLEPDTLARLVPEMIAEYHRLKEAKPKRFPRKPKEPSIFDGIPDKELMQLRRAAIGKAQEVIGYRPDWLDDVAHEALLSCVKKPYFKNLDFQAKKDYAKKAGRSEAVGYWKKYLKKEQQISPWYEETGIEGGKFKSGFSPYGKPKKKERTKEHIETEIRDEAIWKATTEQRFFDPRRLSRTSDNFAGIDESDRLDSWLEAVSFGDTDESEGDGHIVGQEAPSFGTFQLDSYEGNEAVGGSDPDEPSHGIQETWSDVRSANSGEDDLELLSIEMHLGKRGIPSEARTAPVCYICDWKVLGELVPINRFTKWFPVFDKHKDCKSRPLIGNWRLGYPRSNWRVGPDTMKPEKDKWSIVYSSPKAAKPQRAHYEFMALGYGDLKGRKLETFSFAVEGDTFAAVYNR